MPRKTTERVEMNPREEGLAEAPVATAEKDFEQLKLRAELKAIGDVEKQLAVCLAALADRTIQPEQEFWYSLRAAFYCTNLRKFDEAEKSATRASDIARDLKSDLLRAHAIYISARLHQVTREYTLALSEIAACYKILDRSLNGIFKLSLQSIECPVLQAQGRYADAIKVGFEGLALAKNHGSKSDQSLFANVLGTSLMAIGAFDESIIYHLECASLSSESGNTSAVAGCLSNVGHVYREKGNFPEAKRYHEQALATIRTTPLRTNLETEFHVIILTALAEDCNNLGAIDEGIGYLNAALAAAEQVKDQYLIAISHLQYSKLLLVNKRFKDALSHGLNANEYCGEWKDEEDMNLSSILSKTYEGLGEFSNAFEFEKKARAFENGYSKAKLDGQLEYQKYLQKESAEKTAEILRLKERDLANTASSLAAQTELLGNFRADLRKIVLRPDRYEPEDIIRQVKAKLKELPCEMIDFSKFEGQFATVHPEFRARLETTYPELTPQEVKMCMLVHVNLQTAAIARLMCLSERSVEWHRLNIRKKLALTKEQLLPDVLRKLDGK